MNCFWPKDQMFLDKSTLYIYLYFCFIGFFALRKSVDDILLSTIIFYNYNFHKNYTQFMTFYEVIFNRGLRSLKYLKCSFGEDTQNLCLLYKHLNTSTSASIFRKKEEKEKRSSLIKLISQYNRLFSAGMNSHYRSDHESHAVTPTTFIFGAIR